MHRLGFHLLAIPLVVAALGVSRPTAASSLVSISYDITGGTVFGPEQWDPLAPIPIFGGSLTFTLGVPTVTPVAAPGVAGIWSVLLTGVSGTFSATGLAYNAVIGPLTFKLTNVPLLPFSAQTGPVPLITTLTPLSHWASAAGGIGSGAIIFKTPFSGLPTYYSHTFTFGNEVRVYTPEPSTGYLLTSGVALVGLPGLVAPRFWRRG
jgi:hypothetical protein